jgi:polygalacturonase
MKPLQQAKVVAIAPNRLHFEGDFSKVNFQQNDVLTFRDPYRDNCGAFIHLSKNILLENISMHYMHGLGILSQFSENLTLRHISVKPQANSHRIIAAFADCFHFSGCKGLVKIENCETSGAHDDPINVHGTHLQITKIIAPQNW